MNLITNDLSRADEWDREHICTHPDMYPDTDVQNGRAHFERPLRPVVMRNSGPVGDLAHVVGRKAAALDGYCFPEYDEQPQYSQPPRGCMASGVFIAVCFGGALAMLLVVVLSTQ